MAGKYRAAFFWIVFTAAVFTGCATTVSFKTQQPPVWNTLGIQRLAVMPFTATYYSVLQRRTANWLTNEALKRIKSTDHFTLVNSSEVTRELTGKGNIENIADALFNGQLLYVSVRDRTSREQKHNKDGALSYYPLYHREVRMSFDYSLIRTGGGIAGSNTVRDVTISDSNEIRWNLKSEEVMIQELIKSNMAEIYRYIAPYKQTEYRRLEKEKSKDKVIKQRAKEAGELVKIGNYINAQEAFLGVYRDSGSFASAFNAGLLIEAQGDLDGAAAFMQKMYHETGNPKFVSEITRLRKALDDAELLKAYAENKEKLSNTVLCKDIW